MTAQDTPTASTLDAAHVIRQLRFCANLRVTVGDTKHPNDTVEWKAADALAALQQQLDEARAKENELRKAVAQLTGCDVETWPEHGNVGLAIAATVALLVKDREAAELALSEARVELKDCRDEYADYQRSAEEWDRQREAAELALSKRDAPQAQPVGFAAVDVLAERQRQVEAEGWTPHKDDDYQRNELSRAAVAYAHPSPKMSSGWMTEGHDGGQHQFPREVPVDWPFHPHWWKPTTRRRNLVKAGALILAEIERLDRQNPALTRPQITEAKPDALEQALSTERARSEGLVNGQDYAAAVQPYAAALQMVHEAIGELFGPAANLESKDAELLRGPEPHHTAEALIAALQNVALRLARLSIAIEQISVLSDYVSGPDLSDPCLTSENSWGNYDDCFSDGRRQAQFEAASIARAALARQEEGNG